jgi:integrase
MDKLLTVREVAGLLHCHPQTVYKNESIPRADIPGIGIRFSLKDIEKLSEKHRSSPVQWTDKLYNNQLFTLPSPITYGILKSGGKSEMAKAKQKSRINLGYGAIYQRKTKTGNIRWYVDFHDAEGKRVQKLVPHAVTQDEAVLALRVDVSKALSSSCGIQPSKNAVSFQEYADGFKMNYLAVERKNWQSDAFRLNHLSDYFRGKKLEEIDSEGVRQLKKERMDKGNSERTVNRYLALLKRMFNVAIEQGYVKENPVKQVKFFSERDTHRSRILSHEEETRLLAKCPDYLRRIVVLALHTGLRIGEIQQLNWNQVDFGRKEIIVERTKGKKVRFIPMNRILLEELTALKQSSGIGDLVFCFKSIRTVFKNACKKAKIQGFTFHDLRRTFGTRLLEKGIDIITIQRLYGHSNSLVTQLYLHPDDRLGREAVGRLAEETLEKPEFEEIPLHLCDTENLQALRTPASSS